MADDDIMSRSVPCAFEVLGETVKFAVLEITETGGNRLAARERVYRPGARQDSTGTEPDGWSLAVVAYNGMREPGVPADPYPLEVLKLIRLCKVQATGTLTLSTVGPKRARAARWSRRDSFERRDYCAVDVQFVEDNEDDQTAATFSPPNARAAIVSTAALCVEALDGEGVWSVDVASLEQLAGEIEALALAPSDFIGDLEEKTVTMQNRVAAIEAAFVAPGTKLTSGTPLVPGATSASMLSTPGSDRARRLLRELSEMAMRAPSNVPGRRAPIPRVFNSTLSIFAIAADIGQPLDDLVAMNAGLPDLRRIRAGTPVMVRP